MHLSINMGAFGLWVWPAYGCTLLVFAINYAIARCEQRAVRKQIAQNTPGHAVQ